MPMPCNTMQCPRELPRTNTVIQSNSLCIVKGTLGKVQSVFFNCAISGQSDVDPQTILRYLCEKLKTLLQSSRCGSLEPRQKRKLRKHSDAQQADNDVLCPRFESRGFPCAYSVRKSPLVRFKTSKFVATFVRYS